MAQMADLSSSRLGTIALFCKAAETLSFTAAAGLAGTTPSAVSKAVRRLEDQLGVKLFDRSTRAIRLTPEGAAYHQTCRDALDRIQQAELQLAKQRSRPHGTLRVSMTPSYGVVELLPRLARYLDRYQREVKVMASLSNSIAAFPTEGFDVAIRIGKVADSRLVARKLREAHVKVVASPSYLNRYGIPQQPEDLRQHQCIDLLLPDTNKPVPWEFARGKRVFEVPVAPSITVDLPLAAVTAALAGGGMARLLDFTVAADIAAGRLVEVLTAFRPPPTPISIVYPASRHVPVNVRTFVDFLFEEQGRSA
jgi:DNA-binding transcriptional LysR family regulator